MLYEDAVNNLVRVMNGRHARNAAKSSAAAFPTLPPVAVDGADMLNDDLDKCNNGGGPGGIGQWTEFDDGALPR